MQARKPHVCALRHWIRLCAFPPMCEYATRHVCVCVCVYVRTGYGHRGDDSSSYTQCLSSLKPFFLYFLSTVFLLLLLLLLLLLPLLLARAWLLLLAPDHTKGNSFRCYGPPPYKLPVFGVARGWGIARIPLYRFFEKRFRLQYSIRRPRARNAAGIRRPRCFYSEDSGEPSSRKFNKPTTTFVRSSIPLPSKLDLESGFGSSQMIL